MKRAYDHRGAESLIPLLQILTREIKERSEAIRNTHRRIYRHRRDRRNRTREVSSHQIEAAIEAALVAEVANHRREIRLTRKELDRLGCYEDAKNPSRFLIPGSNGEIETGFAWQVGDDKVSVLVP